MLCATINGPSLLDAQQQISVVLPHVDYVELRVDLLSSLSMQELRSLMDLAKKTILTLPPTMHLKEDAWLEKTLHLAQLNPHFLTIDTRFPKSALHTLRHHYPHLPLIYAYHSEKDEDITAVYEAMAKVPASIYKMVVRPKTTIQALEYLAIKQHLPSNTSVLCSGDYGSYSRILSPLIHNAINYTYGSHAEPVLAGQVSLEELHLYNYEHLSPKGKMFALIGEHTHRSISHIANNYLFHHLQLPFCHVKYALHELAPFFPLARKLPFRGMSVTAPFKTLALQYVDHIAPSAQHCQATNTLVFDHDGITAHNTDGEGLAKLLEYKRVPIQNQKIALLGAGGVAKAIVHSLSARGAHLTLFNRSLEKAQQLAAIYGCQAFPLSHFSHAHSFDVIVSCLVPNIPLPDVFAPTVVDVNTLPRESNYLRNAKQQGSFVIYGYEMFAEQALLQFHIWMPDHFHQEMHEPFRQKVKNIMCSL